MRRRLDDSGSALLMVLGAMMVLTIIVTVAGTVAIRTAAFSRHSTDWNQALAAAEAGVDDYLARLNRDDNYWHTLDCTNQAMKKPNVTACSWDASTPVGWVDVPLSPRAEFHYDVVTTSTATNGAITLTSTGRVGSVKRSVETVLRRGGFGEFLYYTVYETTDPANEAVYGLNNSTAQDKCAHYVWEPYVAGVSKPRDTSYCANIQFGSGDKINGPLHSNDTILMSGTPRFQGTVTTSDPACKPVNGVPRPYTACYKKNGSANPQFDKGIAYRTEVDLPTSIGDLKQYVVPSATNTTPGCLYTGPTRIKILPNSSGDHSTMKVWSPWTKTGINAGCGGVSPNGQEVALPHNNLVMVQDVPSSQSLPASGKCAVGAIDGSLPQNNDYNQEYSDANCRYGTLYVEGTLHGRVTMAADNNIIITGDLKYADGKTGLDALGLIAQNSVKIYHPIKCTNTSQGKCTSGQNLSRPSGGTFSSPTVQGSILTLQHSFGVQSYNLGDDLGTLHLFGSFAQRFRGPVATTSGSTLVSGYWKDYEYDTRLRYSPPPFFLDPVRSSWGVKAYGETTSAY